MLSNPEACRSTLTSGSSCFDTAVSGSDLDLLVETDLWVTKKIKNWMRQVFQVGYRTSTCSCGASSFPL